MTSCAPVPARSPCLKGGLCVLLSGDWRLCLWQQSQRAQRPTKPRRPLATPSSSVLLRAFIHFPLSSQPLFLFREAEQPRASDAARGCLLVGLQCISLSRQQLWQEPLLVVVTRQIARVLGACYALVPAVQGSMPQLSRLDPLTGLQPAGATSH